MIESCKCGEKNWVYIGLEWDYNDADGGWEYKMYRCNLCHKLFAGSAKSLGFPEQYELTDSDKDMPQ